MRSVKRNLIKFSGYSLALVLPKKILKDFGWNAADVIRVTSDPKKKRLIVTKMNSAKDPERTPTANPARPSPTTRDSDDIQPIPEL
jgi:bifunctional DNA-binding transcriptional regulator/antitoxin component of YhaV-PrlF toxin-antitoxin module